MTLIDYLNNRLKKKEIEKKAFYLFEPRQYQAEIIKEFYKNNYSLFALCWARRLGKDLLAFSLACKQCLENANYTVFYLFPTMKQARTMILDGRTEDKKSIIETIIDKRALKLPLKSSNLYHSDNTIRFKNGSTIYFLGSDTADTKVGGNLDLLVISEMALIKNSDILTYLIPSVIKVQGKIIVVSTPRFSSYFNDLFDDVNNSNMWYKSELKATDTKAVNENNEPIYTADMLEFARNSMSIEKFEQEYLCNRDIANELSIYARSLKDCEMVDKVARNKLVISFDLGINDSTVLTFYMSDTVINHYQNVGQATQHYINYIEKYLIENQINKKDVELVLPHDANNRLDFVNTLISRRLMYENAGFKCFVLKAQNVNKTIELTRYAIQQKKLKFLNTENVKAMIKLMKSYEFKQDKTTGENLLIPVHGKGMSASNTCDSVEYYCIYRFLKEYEQKRMSYDWGN